MPRFTRRKRMPSSTAGKALALAKKNKTKLKIISPEIKFIDSFNTIALSAVGVVNTLNLVGSGTGPNERIGDSYRNVSLDILINMAAGPGASQVQEIRWIVFYDKHPNSALPVTTDILTSDFFMSMINDHNKARFVILHDKLYSLTDGTSSEGRAFWWRKKWKLGKMSTYGSVGGTITSLNDGLLGYLLLASTGSPALTVNLSSRVKYIDS